MRKLWFRMPVRRRVRLVGYAVLVAIGLGLVLTQHPLGWLLVGVGAAMVAMWLLVYRAVVRSDSANALPRDEP